MPTKKLKVGDKAPELGIASNENSKVYLKDFKGKTVVLYFYPRDLTPGCTIEAYDFSKLLASFKKKKAVILGISKDTVEKHQKFIDKIGIKFPLLSDEDGKVCKAYGVWQKKSFMGKSFMGIVRSTFVIDEKGKIKAIYEKVKVKDHAKTVLKELS